MRLARDEKLRLLALARRSLLSFVRTGRPARPEPEDLSGALAETHAAFVSLHLGDAMRGCLGTAEHQAPLARSVARLAAESAARDPRFDPVTPSEVERLSIEISVLGDFVPLDSPAAVVLGRHGVLVRQEGKEALLLPQVALRVGWTAEKLLEETCLKAGLGRNAWCSESGAKAWIFEAEVFSCNAPPIVFLVGHGAPAPGSILLDQPWVRFAAAQPTAVDVLVLVGPAVRPPSLDAMRVLHWREDQPLERLLVNLVSELRDLSVRL